VDWRQIDDYGLLHLSAHLYALREIGTYRQQSYELICEPLMRQKYTRFGSHRPFIEDVQLAAEAAGSESPPNLVQEVREHLIYATLSSLASAIPLRLLAAMACAGQVERALGFAALRQEKFYQGQAYWLIGLALLEAGEKEKAGEALTAALVPEAVANSQYTEVVSRIAYALARAGSIEQALAVTQMIDHSIYKVQALNGIALTCALVGDRVVAVDIANQALVTAEKELDGGWKAKLSREIAYILAEAGEFDRALGVAEKIEDSFHQVCGVAGIAYVLAREGKKTRAAGLIDKAQEMAETIENFSQKDEAQAAIAEVLAKLGKFDRALAVVETSSTFYRASSLSRIAFALSEAGEQAKALHS